MPATTETPALLEDSSLGRVEDPERSSRRTDGRAPESPKRNPARTPNQASADLARHTRKCAVCNHPSREQIEDDFLRWRDPWDITTWYKLPSRSSLYRHVEAFGLLALRRRNLRGVAERILERIEEVTLKGNNIFQAMRLFAHITEDGQWLEPPKRTIVTHIHTYADSSPDSPPNPHAPAPTSPSSPAHQNGDSRAATPTATHPSSGAASSSICHSEPVAVWPCEESAVTRPRATPSPSRQVATNTPHDGPVAAGSSRQPFAGSASPNPDAPAPPSNLPVSPNSNQFPSCHSERGCDEHPTRLARRGGDLQLDKSASPTERDTQSRASNTRSAPSAVSNPDASKESLPIARFTRAKSFPPRHDANATGHAFSRHCLSNRDTNVGSRSRK